MKQLRNRGSIVKLRTVIGQRDVHYVPLDRLVCLPRDPVLINGNNYEFQS